MSGKLLENVQSSVLYQLFDIYEILVEDFLFMYYNGKKTGEEKLSNIAKGAKREYEDSSNPTWKRAWMKARYKRVSKYLEKEKEEESDGLEK